MTHVSEFENCLNHIWELKPDGNVIPEGEWKQKISYGPYGINLQPTLTPEALNCLWWVFNGIAYTNSARLLVLDAKHHNAMGDISRAILDLATALEVNIESLMNIYSSVSQQLLQIDFDGISVYKLYDAILSKATDHSLHEKPDLYAELEYIRELRNSIAHRWKPYFKISNKMKNNSRYLSVHQPKDGHIISTSQEVDQLITHTENIIKFSTEVFEHKYGKI